MEKLDLRMIKRKRFSCWDKALENNTVGDVSMDEIDEWITSGRFSIISKRSYRGVNNNVYIRSNVSVEVVPSIKSVRADNIVLLLLANVDGRIPYTVIDNDEGLIEELSRVTWSVQDGLSKARPTIVTSGNKTIPRMVLSKAVWSMKENGRIVAMCESLVVHHKYAVADNRLEATLLMDQNDHMKHHKTHGRRSKKVPIRIKFM